MAEKPWGIRVTNRIVRCLVLDKIFPHNGVKPCPDQVREVARMLGSAPSVVIKDLYFLNHARQQIYGASEEWNDREKVRQRIQKRIDVAAEIARRLVSGYQEKCARKGLSTYDIPPCKELISDIFFRNEPGRYPDPAGSPTHPETDPWENVSMVSDQPESQEDWDE